MIVKKKSKVTKALIAASFLIGIIAIVTPVIAANSNRVFFMAKGDDLDLNATNLIIGKIKFGGDDEPLSARVFFHSKIYDDSGEKVYTMIGMLKDGLLITTDFEFYCPVLKVWFRNVWWFKGVGKFWTTDTNIEVFFRESLTITMPNTEGKYVPASIFMWLSPTDGWALAGVFWNVSIPIDFGFGLGILPIGPFSYLTISIGI